MADLFDYLEWRGDLSLRCMPFNPVDGLILSCFAGLTLAQPLPETLGAAAKRADAQGNRGRLAAMLSESPRFRAMRLIRFEEKFSREAQMQFAALTLDTGDGCSYVAFRGTDGTLVGWKEDFNLSFAEEVPAQREALKWLGETAALRKGPIRVGGHSKGGNLAVYAAARSAPAVQARLRSVANYDGPGMSAAVMQSEGYAHIEPAIETYLPESSVVGVLLERAARFHVVQSDAVGPLQHDPFSWQVRPEGFVLLEGLDRLSLFADRTVRAWLNTMDMDTRRSLVDALYAMAEATGARTVTELAESWPGAAPEVLNAFAGLPVAGKAALLKGLGRLAAATVQQLNHR